MDFWRNMETEISSTKLNKGEKHRVYKNLCLAWRREVPGFGAPRPLKLGAEGLGLPTQRRQTDGGRRWRRFGKVLSLNMYQSVRSVVEINALNSRQPAPARLLPVLDVVWISCGTMRHVW